MGGFAPFSCLVHRLVLGTRDGHRVLAIYSRVPVAVGQLSIRWTSGILSRRRSGNRLCNVSTLSDNRSTAGAP